MTYLDLVRELPRPTQAQCEAFARGMAGKHSWYKHLPVAPAVPFRFLLAPRAPQSSEYGSRLMDQRTVHVRTASDHEQTYGFWDCLAPFEMGLGLGAKHRAEVEAARDIWVAAHGAAAGRVDVPEALVDMGTVRVNAFVDIRAPRMAPDFWLSSSDLYGAAEYLGTLGLDAPGDPSRFRDLWVATITREHLTEARARTLAAMVEAMSRVSAAIWGAPA